MRMGAVLINETYIELIYEFYKLGKLDSISKAFKEMKQLGLRLNEVSYTRMQNKI